jgi:protein subunit release factor A
MNLDQYKNNPKTAFLVSVYEDLVKQETETRSMMEKDPSMKELVEADLVSIKSQMTEIQKQMDEILEKDKQEDDKPNEIILEVRAGAGGDEAALLRTLKVPSIRCAISKLSIPN